jgi:hypothetical protein
MSVGFLKVLQKAGLVQIDDDPAAGSNPDASRTAEGRHPDADRDPGRMLSSNLVVAPAPEVLPAAACAVDEQRSLEVLYHEQAVPPSPFPAEKLLKLLDGLRAMEPAVRKAAVLAMDAADDAWTVDDAVLDAQRKIGALQQAQAYLAQQTASAQAHAQQELQQRDHQHETAVEAVKRQIAELEALREREVEKAAADRAAIQTKAKAVEAASLRETARLEAELSRLRQIIEIFATAPTPSPTASISAST